MRSIVRPALAPALAFLLGGALPLALPVVSVPMLGALAGLGTALGGETGMLVAFGAAGALGSAVRWVLPARRDPPIDPDRPVEARAVAVGHASRSAFGWSQPVRIEALRQGNAGVRELEGDVLLTLPAGVTPPDLGATVHVAGYLRRTPGFADEPAIAPGDLRLSVKTQALLRVEAPAPAWLRPSTALRRRLDAAARREEARGRHGAALASALLIGDTSAVPDAWRRDLRRTGLLHLLAVSGFNVSLLLLTVWVLALRLTLRVRAVLAASVVGVFVAAVGPLPSVLRAGIMGALLLAALLLRRPPVAANAMAVAALALTLLDPSLVGALGFQLTFAATTGLIFLTPLLREAWKALPAWLSVPLGATWAAQLATLPWAILAFHQIQPAAFLCNLVFVPLASSAMLGDLVWAIAATVHPAWGTALDWLPEVLASPFGWLGALPPGPWLVIPVALRTAPLVLSAIGFVTALACRRWTLAVGLLAACAWAVPVGERRHGVEVSFLDVGQGDAALLRDGDAAILVDGGGFAHGDFGGSVLLPILAETGVRRLQAVVMTHGDTDHCRGLVDIADYLPVGELWLTRGQEGSACARELLERRRLRPRFLAAGAHLVLGRWRLDVLGPEAGERGAPTSDNDGSIVFRAAAGGRVFLFAGDIERAAEERLVRSYGAGLRATVLKVPHHGSRSSSHGAFLAAVEPRVAVVSAGIANRFGHPHADVLARYATAGVRLLRTDRDGEVVFRLQPDGRHWRLELPATPRGSP